MGSCSCGSPMLKPMDGAPASAAPRFAASMMPGPPPVAMTLSRGPSCAIRAPPLSDASRPKRRASSYQRLRHVARELQDLRAWIRRKGHVHCQRPRWSSEPPRLATALRPSHTRAAGERPAWSCREENLDPKQAGGSWGEAFWAVLSVMVRTFAAVRSQYRSRRQLRLPQRGHLSRSSRPPGSYGKEVPTAQARAERWMPTDHSDAATVVASASAS